MALYVGGTSLLLHGNGADGSTVFTDETGKTVTAYGNAHISTAQSKFGGASMAFGLSGDRLDAANSDTLIFGTGDFTIELFCFPLGLNGVLCTKRAYNTTGTGSWRLMVDRFEQLENPTSLLSWTSLATGQWSHLAIARHGGVLRVFVNGTQVSSVASSFNLSSVEKLTIGGDNDSSVGSANGYIDDLHIVKGVALYTADFTPPTAPLEITPGIQIAIQTNDSGITKLAKYDPSQIKPVISEVTNDLQNQMPYGLWKTPAVFNEFKGHGRITGTVKNTPGTPVYRQVRLHREPDGMFVMAVWSDPITGAYTFNGVRPDVTYTVTSYDHTQAYRAVIADRVIPEALP